MHKYNRNFTGRLMAVDTIGSVLGSILSTLLLMPVIGVNYTVVLVVVLCLIGAIMFAGKINFYWLGLIIAAAYMLNRSELLYQLYYIVEDNAVSTISIYPEDDGQSTVMSINGSCFFLTLTILKKILLPHCRGITLAKYWCWGQGALPSDGMTIIITIPM